MKMTEQTDITIVDKHLLKGIFEYDNSVSTKCKIKAVEKNVMGSLKSFKLKPESQDIVKGKVNPITIKFSEVP